MPDAILRLEKLTRRFSPQRAALFEDLNLELARGEYLALMGESGVGKSTLLNLISALDRPDAGRVMFDGQEVSGLDDDGATLWRRRDVGFVFQAFHVLPYLSVRENVALPLDLLSVREPERSRRTTLALERTGIGALAERRVGELSGGEKQRVAIARALVHGPKLVLADEPTGSLDPHTAAHVLALLRTELKANGVAGLLITHSAAAARTADRCVILEPGGFRAFTP